MRVGKLGYINAFPFYAGFEKHVACSAELVSGHPTELNQMLSQGELDISLVSSFEYLQNQEKYTLLPNFCIAAEGPVQSVVLHAKKDFQEVALTPESSSSAELVKLLCRNFWHVDPKFIPLPDIESATNYDAFLLIGDQALAHPFFPGYEKIDLSAVWHEKTQLPMTFAVFAARKETPQDRVDAFSRELADSLRWGEENPEIICDLAHKHSKLPLNLIQSYYPLLKYRLGDAELAGLKTYGALCGIN